MENNIDFVELKTLNFVSICIFIGVRGEKGGKATFTSYFGLM